MLRKILSLVVIVIWSNTFIAGTSLAVTEKQQITPEQALKLLKDGNQRFVDNKVIKYDYSAIRQATAFNQHPFAVVLGCVDSRSIPDIIFNQGLGNIFVARVAGNVVNQDMLGSFEFATKYAGAKVIVVMGHTNCGAVQAACKRMGEGNLKKLLNKIYPAVQAIADKQAKQCNNENYLNRIARQNVINQVKDIYNRSPRIRTLVNEKKVILVGAMNNLKTGKVDFFYRFKP